MKKINSLIAVIILTAFTTSCTKEDEVTTNEMQNQSVMRFASEKEMNDKIAEIEAFQKSQEAQILEELLKRNNLKAPVANDVKNITTLNANVKIDKNAILEDVKFYHQEKLKGIYAERAHFGFTSVQSIADEINFTKLINPDKSKQLFDNYKSLLIKNEYETKSVFNKGVSTVINNNGEIFLGNKNIAKNYLEKEKVSNTTDKSLSAGWLASGYNNFVVITYGTDVDYSARSYPITLPGGGSVIHNDYIYKPSTTLTSFVLSAYGYVLYPCYFYTNPGSYAIFNINTIATPLNFGNGYGNHTRVISNELFFNGNITLESVSGSVSGNFAVPSGATFLWVSGTKTF